MCASSSSCNPEYSTPDLLPFGNTRFQLHMNVHRVARLCPVPLGACRDYAYARVSLFNFLLFLVNGDGERLN